MRDVTRSAVLWLDDDRVRSTSRRIVSAFITPTSTCSTLIIVILIIIQWWLNFHADYIFIRKVKAAFRLASFWRKFSCIRKLAQVTRSHYASFLFKKVVIRFGKIRSPVDRPISGGVSRQKLAWNRTRSTPAGFWRQFFVPEKWHQKPRSHRQVFWRKKFETETCQYELGLRYSFFLWSLRNCVNKKSFLAVFTGAVRFNNKKFTWFTHMNGFFDSMSILYVMSIVNIQFLHRRRSKIHCESKKTVPFLFLA